METLNHLIIGFSLALSWQNLLWCFTGVTLGTLVGILPGLGPMAAISMLLPLTYNLNDPVAAIIFLSGLYYGTQYGGSTTSILLKLPGEAASVVTTLDGYAMTQNGRSGAALAIAAGSSFFAGTVATVLIMILAKPLAGLALMFGPTEYASLMLLGILASIILTDGSYLKGIAVSLIGMLLGIVGTDVNTGIERFTFGSFYLLDGISFAIVAMGIFGIGEVLFNLIHKEKKFLTLKKISSLYPTREEINQSKWATVRGTVIGSVLGLLPGGGALIGSFASYALEKKLSRSPESFGRGNPAGVAAPEAANNAGAQTSFIPMLSLGIPITPVMALMVAALMVNGMQPGPYVLNNNSDLFWALIASMWIGNFFLLILNLPLIAIWVSVLKIKWVVIYPLIMLTCVLGAYYINHNWFDILLLALFGLIGYLFRLFECNPVPLTMGFIVGTFFEEYLRRSLIISQGNWYIFLERPISFVFLSITISILVYTLLLQKKSSSN